MSSLPYRGFPSKTDYIVSRRLIGLSVSQIAAETGWKRSTVSMLIKKRRESRKISAHSVRVPIDSEMLARLEMEADSHARTPMELARDIITRALDGDLVDAILDEK